MAIFQNFIQAYGVLNFEKKNIENCFSHALWEILQKSHRIQVHLILTPSLYWPQLCTLKVRRRFLWGVPTFVPQIWEYRNFSVRKLIF